MSVKIQIKGIIETLSGLHIGGNSSFSAIGAIDSVVIRDPISNAPIIPGSSLKGKIRSLLAKEYNESKVSDIANDNPALLDLFGYQKDNKSHVSRLIFTDSVMKNVKELEKYDVYGGTEIKFENTINRLTAVANPRQIERVVKGALFPFTIIYDAPTNDNNVIITEKIKKDLSLLCDGFTLLEYDYLGGNGSRGYGKIKFKNVEISTVFGDLDASVLEECQKLFEKFN